MARRRSSPYSHFLTLYKRGYLRDQIVRIMHVEGYKNTTKEIREWFKTAPDKARVERRGTLKLEHCMRRDESGRCVGINPKDRFWGYMYRIQSQIDPELAAAAVAWKSAYGEPEFGEPVSDV